jgi:hypothetical protein
MPRPRRVPAKVVPRAERTPVILLTGGLGDVFAIEAHFPPTFYDHLRTILYATHKHAPIRQCFQALPSGKPPVEHRVVWSDFSSFFAFHTKPEVEKALRRRRGTAEALAVGRAADFSICRTFPAIRSRVMRYQGSSFLKHTLAPKPPDLPPRYVAVCPYSSDKRFAGRDFDDSDWQALLGKLKENNLKGVVLNDAREFVPEDDSLLDYSARLSITEAIEVLKGAYAYAGIDSCLSVLAAKLFPADKLTVKTVNGHCVNHRAVYFAPHQSFEFLANRIDCSRLVLQD